MACYQLTANASTVALTASTAKSVLGFQAPTNQVVKILELAVSFDGATSTNAPAVVDFCRCTFATNAPGTNSTAVTAGKCDPARAETVQTTFGKTWTTEPTVITVFRTLDIGQFNGLYHNLLAFTGPILVVGGQGFVVRVNSPNNVNASLFICVEE